MTDTIAVIVGEIRQVAQCLRGVSYLVSNEVDALADRLAALGWRPISEAPKDGRRVLAFAGSRPFIARHGRATGWWDDNDLMRDPTHWMPLPAAPTGGSHD